MKKITIYYVMTLMALAILFFFLQWKVAKDARARGPQESQGEAGA